MLRYAITDRRLFAGDEAQRTTAFLAQVRRLAKEQIDYLQLREKDLGPGALLALALRVRGALPADSRPRLLLNGPIEIALRAQADGVHLSGGWTPTSLAEQRSLASAAAGKPMLLSVACHSVEESRSAALAGADLILFSPVFEKRLGETTVITGAGLHILRDAAAAAGGTPVLALGGVTAQNAAACLANGAAGIAGIRLFAQFS